jgi:predicted DNA-binding protein with PD1-like motif
MKAKLINPAPKTYAVVFDSGDEVMSGLLDFAKETHLGASHLTAIGAFSEVTLGFFIPEEKRYKKMIIREQVEVLSLIGDIALQKGEPKLHVHVVVGKADATAHGGHLVAARVRPTLEVIATESLAHLHRMTDPQTGLALINLSC